jgi:predicted alpha/beta superfamily hydrolase
LFVRVPTPGGGFRYRSRVASAKGKNMGKWFVWSWGLIVIATLVAMQFALFGTLGLPKSVRGWFGGAGSSSRPRYQPPKSDAPKPAAEGKLVQPESLEQGFIVLVTDKTHVANASSPIFMPSSHNGWNPGDPKMQLTAQSDQKWRIVWEKPKLDSRVAFKFARGSWEKVETDANFKDIENRMLPMVDVSGLKPGEKPVIELTVENWIDKKPGGTGVNASDRYRAIHVSAGTLQRMEVVGGGGPGAESLARDLLVWLPPGYDAPENSAKMYPVLYLMDGQNVFEKHAGIPAEWGADETAAALIAARKIEPLIIVGVPNAETLRSQEYLPFALIDGVQAHGTQFIEFLLNEAMPRIERSFRVKTGPESTGIGGASLGAVIALEAATEHPDVFGKALCESMPLTMKERAAFKHFGLKKNWPAKIAFGMGGHELGKDPKNEGGNKALSATAMAFKELAAGHGLGSDRFKLTIDEDAVHDETAWAKRLGGDLEFLFPAK